MFEPLLGILTRSYVAATCEEWPNSVARRSASGSVGEVMGVRSYPFRSVSGVEGCLQRPDRERMSKQWVSGPLI
jgi:hypothetical protein